jgi:hypothetical protein
VVDATAEVREFEVSPKPRLEQSLAPISHRRGRGQQQMRSPSYRQEL